MEIKINTRYKSTGGDEISHYDAAFETKPILKEFVSWILSEKSGEWGYIEDSEHPDNPQCQYFIPKKIMEYSHGEIVSLCEDYDQLKNKTITLTNMDGGWSRMDYTIKFID